MNGKDENQQQKVPLNINLDTTPILYTDSVFMTINKYGLVLDVVQKIGNQSRIVSRIGMSRDHANQFVKELSKLLVVTAGSGKTKKN